MSVFHHAHHQPQPWEQPAHCDEFRGTGIELQLIDAVDALERAEALGLPERTALAVQVRRLQDELIALAA